MAAEYGGSAPHSLSEYYRSGGNVPNSITVNVPAGSFTAEQYSTSSPIYWWRTAINPQLYWNGVIVSSGSFININATSFSTGGFDYHRGAFVENFTTGSGKTSFTAANYKIKRRTSATTSTQNVNQNVPTSGQVTLSDYYGGRAS